MKARTNGLRKEAAEAFYDTEEYWPYRESRIAGAKNEVFPVAGEDVRKAAPIAGVVSSGSKAAALQAGLALCCASL